MQESKEYNNFKFLSANRPIDYNHVNKIKKSLQEYGFLDSQPITVNSEMEIIDGQHRFVACKEMGLPIKFVQIQPKRTDNILVSLNTTQKLEYQRDKCYECSTTAGYIKMLETIYNNKRRHKLVFDEERLRNANN